MSPMGTTNIPTPAMKNMSKDEKYSVQLKQGRPIYGVELKVVDDKGNELPKDGESQGHLMVRGPWNVPGAAQESDPARFDKLECCTYGL